MSNGKRQAVCDPNEVDTLSLTAKVQRRDSSSRRERKLIPSWRWQETHDGPQQPQRFIDVSVRRIAWQFPASICISQFTLACSLLAMASLHTKPQALYPPHSSAPAEFRFHIRKNTALLSLKLAPWMLCYEP